MPSPSSTLTVAGGDSREHLLLCTYCARAICANDVEPREGRCATCRRLVATTSVSADIIAAAAIANGGSTPSTRSMRVAQDTTYAVVDVDLGWSRHLVFSVVHGEREPYTVVAHSLIGSGVP